jgi:hypothetical protein
MNGSTDFIHHQRKPPSTGSSHSPNHNTTNSPSGISAAAAALLRQHAQPNHFSVHNPSPLHLSHNKHYQH